MNVVMNMSSYIAVYFEYYFNLTSRKCVD